MRNIVINGPCRLNGEVMISGAKNAAVAILPATILVNGKCRIENLPHISDIILCCDILKDLGATVNFINDNEVEIDTSSFSPSDHLSSLHTASSQANAQSAPSHRCQMSPLKPLR